MRKSNLKDKIIEILLEGLEGSPHKIVYDKRYPGELYVVSTNYRKMISKVVDKIMELFDKN